ncbi:unnamed protein product, partial [Ilex paraguariensis]
RTNSCEQIEPMKVFSVLLLFMVLHELKLLHNSCKDNAYFAEGVRLQAISLLVIDLVPSDDASSKLKVVSDRRRPLRPPPPKANLGRHPKHSPVPPSPPGCPPPPPPPPPPPQPPTPPC